MQAAPSRFPRRIAVTLSFAVAASAGCVLHSQADLEAAHYQHMARLCGDQNYAYETGYNRGLERRPLDTGWVDGCAPQWQPTIRASYQAGYQAGIQYAPVVVRHRGGVAPAPAPAPARYVERCTFSSDCGDGRTCRSGQCMGNGYAGDACWFSSDCLSDSCDLSRRVCN
jgi:hypothetical protein